MTAEPQAGTAQAGQRPSIGDVIEKLPFSRTHFWALFATVFGFFFDAVDTTILSLALPSIVKEWGLDGATAGFIGGSIFWGMMIGAACLGFVADMIGRRWTMVITVAGMAVFTALCGLAWNVESFVTFRIITGVFAGAMIPLDLSYLAEVAPKKNRGMIMGSIGVSWPVGALAATLLSGAMLSTIGWRWMFIIMLVPAVVALLVRALVPESPRWLAKKGRWDEAVAAVNRLGAKVGSVGELDTSHDDEGSEKISFFTGIRQIFQPRYLKRVIGGIIHYFLAYGLMYGWSVFLPTILLTALGYPLNKTIGAVVATNIASILGRLTVMFTANKLSRFWTLVVSLTLYMVAALGMSVAIGFGPELTWLFMAIMVLFQYTNDVSTVFQQWMPEVFPSEIRAFAASFTSAFGRLAAAIMPIIVGAMIAGHNVKSVFYMIAIIAALLIINVSVFLRKSDTAGKSLSDIKAD